MVATLFGGDCPDCQLSSMTYSGGAVGSGTNFSMIPNTQGQTQPIQPPVISATGEILAPGGKGK